MKKQAGKTSVQRSSAPKPEKMGTTVSEASLRGANHFTPLNKKSFEPLYFQIQKQLERQIRLRKLVVDDPLPGEGELSRIFAVSRMTSRQALQGLTADGFAYRERGRGTFVRGPKVEKQVEHLLGFSAEMRSLGLRPSSELLARSVDVATPQVAAALQLPPTSKVIMLHRLRSAEGEPIAIEQVWIPHARFAGIEDTDFGRNSLYETLREEFGVRVASANETIEARGANREEAQLLQIAVRSSLLVVNRTLLDFDGCPVETGRSLYRGDRYKAVLSIPAVRPAHSDAPQLRGRRDGRESYIQ